MTEVDTRLLRDDFEIILPINRVSERKREERYFIH